MDENAAGAEVAYRFDLPYGARAARMINPELGLHNVVARAGHNAAYTIEITLLDAPDHRLIRSGVLLAHRVIDGRGEWYLGAPDWDPLLPGELIEPMSQAELPDRFADLVAPFRRRATLGPVAAISCDRSEFAIRDDQGHTLALLRDDKVTVRRGGLTTARYRQVLLTAIGRGLDADQVAFLQHALGLSGATPVPRFPRLVARLGAPATGLTDYPVVAETHPDDPFEAFVSALLATRQRELLRADLAVRGEATGAADELGSVARALREELQGLAAVLQPLWSQDLAEELDWLVEQVETAPDALKVRLRGERYLTLLERLVNAVRAPQLGDSAGMSSAEVVEALVTESVTTLVEVADRVRVDAPRQVWDDLGAAFAAARRTVAVAGRVGPERCRRIDKRLEGVEADLAEVQARVARLDEIRREAEHQPADVVFEAGRLFEREQQRLDAARETYCEHWPKVAPRLLATLGPVAAHTRAKKKRNRR